MRINAAADMQRGAGNGEDQSLSFLVTTRQFIRICLLGPEVFIPPAPDGKRSWRCESAGEEGIEGQGLEQ